MEKAKKSETKLTADAVDLSDLMKSTSSVSRIKGCGLWNGQCQSPKPTDNFGCGLWHGACTICGS